MSPDMFAMIGTVVVAHFLALTSPGPDFFLIVKSAVNNRKSRALGVAFGIASANGVYVFLCLIGVGSILATSLILMAIQKIPGGLFSVVLTNQAGTGFRIGLGIWMILAVLLWDSFIIFTLSQKHVRAVFGKMAFWVDKIAGTILGIIGLKLFQSALFDENKI